MRSRPPRGIDLAALRREQRVGNWGHASEHIGHRWEEVGLQRMRPLLEGHRRWPRADLWPKAWVALAMNDVLQLTLSRVGLPSPDVIVGLGDRAGGLVVQAIDLKWNLEYANYRQISAGALRELLSRDIPGLSEQVRTSILPSANGVAYVDGYLFAPDTPVNRWFLGSHRNARLEYPIEVADVLFERVDGEEFFSSLPGWDMALLLADLDRSPLAIRAIEGAERYYRLGAGLLGATAQLTSSVFVQNPPPVDAESAFAWLGATFRAGNADLLVQEVERRMNWRRQLVDRLREVMRSPYRLGDLAETLRKRGLALPEEIDEDSPFAARCRDLLRQVAADHREAVRARGLQLVESGMEDAEALAAIRNESGRFRAAAVVLADRLAESMFSGD